MLTYAITLLHNLFALPVRQKFFFLVCFSLISKLVQKDEDFLVIPVIKKLFTKGMEEKKEGLKCTKVGTIFPLISKAHCLLFLTSSFPSIYLTFLKKKNSSALKSVFQTLNLSDLIRFCSLRFPTTAEDLICIIIIYLNHITKSQQFIGSHKVSITYNI